MEPISFGNETFLRSPHAETDTHIVLTNGLAGSQDKNIHVLNLRTGAGVSYRHGVSGAEPFAVTILGGQARFRVVMPDPNGHARMHHPDYIKDFPLP